MDWMKDLQHKRAGGLASSTGTLLGIISIPIFVSVKTACAQRAGTAARESLQRDRPVLFAHAATTVAEHTTLATRTYEMCASASAGSPYFFIMDSHTNTPMGVMGAMPASSVAVWSITAFSRNICRTRRRRKRIENKRVWGNAHESSLATTRVRSASPTNRKILRCR